MEPKKNKRPTLGPDVDEAMGPRGYADNTGMVGHTGPPTHGMAVERTTLSKNSMGDPSMGTAIFRAQAMERSGARYRVHPVTTQPNVPMAGATQANGRIITTRPAVSQDKRWAEPVADAFDDAAVIAGRGEGDHRLRGYTAKNG